MKKIAIGVAAAAALIVTALPALAVDVYVGPGGVGVNAGRPGYHHDRGYYNYAPARHDYGRGHYGDRRDHREGLTQESRKEGGRSAIGAARLLIRL
jgi:hypothetical protein